MTAFDFFSVPRIVFGRGRITELGPIAHTFGNSALIIHNGGEVGAGGAVDKAADSLKAAGLRLSFFRQRGEPTTTDVDAALATARADQSQVIICVGGGSAIDCAKAVAGLLTNGGSALDYMEVIGQGRKITQPAAPWIAVPTTAGTGAEVTRNAVIGSKEHKYKASLRSEHLMAKVALVDAELGVDTPPGVTAASGMDALVQLIESITSRGATPMTTALADAGLSSAMFSLQRVMLNPDEIELRESMAFAAMLSGVTLTNAGLGAVHGFAAPIGANFPAPHGVVCARLLSPVVAANLATITKPARFDPLWNAYAKIGLRALATGLGSAFGSDDARVSPERAVENLPDRLAALADRLQIPRLAVYGLREEHIPNLVSLAKKSSSMKFNPVVLPDDVLANILRSAL